MGSACNRLLSKFFRKSRRSGQDSCCIPVRSVFQVPRKYCNAILPVMALHYMHGTWNTDLTGMSWREPHYWKRRVLEAIRRPPRQRIRTAGSLSTRLGPRTPAEDHTLQLYLISKLSPHYPTSYVTVRHHHYLFTCTVQFCHCLRRSTQPKCPSSL